MGWILRWFACALGFAALGASASTPGADLDTFIETELPRSAAPGLAYARIEDGAITAKGFGETVSGSGERVTADTLFPIGSVTKSFTALSIVQLMEAGKLDLNDPVAQHLPDFTDSPARNVTLRQLLNHTSGFSTVQGNSHHGDSEAPEAGPREGSAQFARLAPVNPPGTRWEYSNLNYQILGAVIEQVSGENYSDYINAHIFAPLGMERSAILVGAAPSGLATGHRPWFGGVRAFDQSERSAINAPAGGIISSANDMARYLSMWMNGEDDIISAKSKTMMLEPSAPASPGYGLGWSIDQVDGTAYHTGLVPGAETLAMFDLAVGKGVVVMVNANSGLGFADTWYLIGGAGARAMGGPHTDDGSRRGPQFIYLSVMLAPLLFLGLAFAAWRGRETLRAKRSSMGGKFSLFFPLAAMATLAAFLILILPRMFGGSLATLQLYQPDFAWGLIATAILGPAWAVLRLVFAHTTRGAS